MSVIAAYIRRFADPPSDQVEAFEAAGRPRELKAGQNFCELGQETHEFAFIHEGIVRYHVILPNGEEATKDFSFADSFTVAFGSAVSGRPCEVAISAVIPCRLTVWPWRAMTALFDRDPQWQKLGRRIAEVLYVRKEQRELSFLLQDAETRYQTALRSFPPALASVPQYFLASYLGIRPQSLSRLKKKYGHSHR